MTPKDLRGTVPTSQAAHITIGAVRNSPMGKANMSICGTDRIFTAYPYPPIDFGTILQ